MSNATVQLQRLSFRLPMLPPSVNHYTLHGGGKHYKSPEAAAFERDFPLVLPTSARGAFVTSESKRFAVTVRINPGPGGRGDIDNRSKLLLDCCAAAGMFRDGKGREVSDAHVKETHHYLDDSPEQRREGPYVDITIENR